MWFLLWGGGAIVLGVAGLPAARRLPVPPPPEALLAGWFLLAALGRLLALRIRLAVRARKARRLARRRADRPPSALGELGAGVGRGALQAAAGDLVGAGISLAAALVKGAATSAAAPAPPQERRRSDTWERLRALACIAGVGLVCVAVAWEPTYRARWRRAAVAALQPAPAGKAAPSAPSAPSAAPAPAPPSARAASTAPLRPP